MRSEPTEAERLLWAMLRANAMGGVRFRRQHPLGPYIVDFACLERRLVVEVDGGGHGGEYDRLRDEWLSSQGFRVLRVWNNEALGNIEGVLSAIRRELGL